MNFLRILLEGLACAASVLTIVGTALCVWLQIKDDAIRSNRKL